MSETSVLKTHNVSDKLTLQVRLDSSLNAAILVLATPDLPQEALSKIRDQIKACYGDEFSIVEIDSKPRLAKVLLIDSSELTQNLITNMLRHIEAKLSECGIVNLIEELAREAEKARTKKKDRATRSGKR